jgi:hypothetical protein
MRGAEVAEAPGLERISSAGILRECADTAAEGYRVSVKNDVSYRVSATQPRTDTPLRACLVPRVGSQHCQKGSPEFLKPLLGFARQSTAVPLLLRLDGGNDAIASNAVVKAHN